MLVACTLLGLVGGLIDSRDVLVMSAANGPEVLFIWCTSALLAAAVSAAWCTSQGRLLRQAVGLRIVAIVVIRALGCVVLGVGCAQVGHALARGPTELPSPSALVWGVSVLALRWATLVSAVVALNLRPWLAVQLVIATGWLLPRALPALSFLDPSRAISDAMLFHAPPNAGWTADIGAVVSLGLAAILLERRVSRAP